MKTELNLTDILVKEIVTFKYLTDISMAKTEPTNIWLTSIILCCAWLLHWHSIPYKRSDSCRWISHFREKSLSERRCSGIPSPEIYPLQMDLWFVRYLSLINPQRADVWEYLIGPGGGPNGPQLKIGPVGYIPGPEDHKPYQGTLGTLEVILIWSRTRLGPAMDPTGTLSWTLFSSIFLYTLLFCQNSLFRNPELRRKKSSRDLT